MHASAGMDTGVPIDNSDGMACNSDGMAWRQRDTPRMSDWRQQPQGEDPWAFGQEGQERNTAQLAVLCDLISKIAAGNTAGAARAAKL